MQKLAISNNRNWLEIFELSIKNSLQL